MSTEPSDINYWTQRILDLSEDGFRENAVYAVIKELLKSDTDGAALATERAKLDFLKSKGLTVGTLNDGHGERLAYVIEPESELCDLKHIHRAMDVERKLTAERDQALAEVAALKAKSEAAEKERDDYKEQLDDIKDRLLPDDSPCKHKETGCSLHDDINDLLNERVKYKSIYNEVFGILYSAGFHNGSVQDKARATVAELATLRGVNEQLRTALENYRHICPCGGTGTYMDGPPDDPQPRECEWCYAARQALSTPSPTSNEEALNTQALPEATP